MTQTSHAPPTTAQLASDTALAEIWAELLALDPATLPADVSFLRLGGDSVLAVRMSALVRRRFGVQLALSDVRVDTTLTDLADLVRRRIAGGALTGETLPAELRRRRDPTAPFTLLPLQQGYFVGQQDGWELSYDTAHFYLDLGLRDLDGDEAPDALTDALHRLARHQPTLRARVTADGRQHVLPPDAPGAVPPLQVVDLRTAADAVGRLDDIRREMSTRGPDPTRGPGIEVRLTLLGGERARLHLSISLLVVDGWSANVLTRELLTLAADWNAALPPLDMDFGDYVTALADLADTDAWAADRDWWHARLATAPQPPALPLTTDPRDVKPVVMGNREARLDAVQWTGLREQCAAHNVTPSTALLTAFSAVLARWAGQHRLLLNTLQLNRLPLHPDVHRVIGAFASTMLLPVELTPGETFAALAGEVQRRFGDHAAHNLVSGVEVARELGRLRGTHRPVAPVVFQSTIGMDAAMGDRAPRHAGPLGEVVVEDYHHQLRTPQVAMEARVFELRDELVLVFSVVEEIFEPDQVEQAFGDFVALAGALAVPAAWTQTVALPTAPDPVHEGPPLRLGQSPGNPSPTAPDQSGPPRDGLERRIAALWSQLLDIDVNDRSASFFALGGDSLLAVRALAGLARDGITGVSIRQFLAAPTVAGIATAARPGTTA